MRREVGNGVLYHRGRQDSRKPRECKSTDGFLVSARNRSVYQIKIS